MVIQHFYSQTVADGTATSVVRPSDWNSNHKQVLNIAGNTSGTSQISGSDIVWAGGNNVTLHGAGSTMSVVGPSLTAYLTTAQPPGAYLTTAAQSDHSHGFVTTTTNGAVAVVAGSNSNGVTLANPAWITTYANDLTSGRAGTGFTSVSTVGAVPAVTLNTNGLSMGVPAWITTYAAQTNQTQASGNIAGVGTTFAGTNISGSMGLNSAGLALSLSVAAGGGAGDGYNSAQFTNSTANSTMPLVWAGNSNGSGNVTIGLTGSTITMSAPSGGGAGDGGNIIAAGGVTANSTGTVVFGNANNVSFGLNAGTVTATATFAQSADTNKAGVGYTSTTQAGSTVGATNNTAGLSMAWPPFLTTAQAPGAYLTTAAQSNHSHNFATAATAGSVMVVGTTNSAGATVGVPAWITTYAAQTNQTAASGNIAGVGTTFGGTNVSGSMTLNSNGLALSLSAPTPGGGGAINVAAGTTNGNVQTLSFVNSNGVSFGLNGSTITASANAGGGAAATGFWFQPEIYGNSIVTTHANGTLYLRPIELDGYYDVDKYIFQQSMASSISTGAVTASVSAGSASSGTGTWGQSGTVILFSRVNTNETNASYNSIVSFASDVYSISAGYSSSVSWSTNVSSCTASWTTSGAVGFIKNIDGAGNFTTSSSGTSGSSTFSSTSTNANSFSSTYAMSFPYAHMSGVRPLFVPAGVDLVPGEYWLGMIQSSTGGSTNDSRISRNAVMVPTMQYFTASTNNYLEIGNSVALTTSNFRIGFGSHSASSLTTTNIALSQVSLMASNASMYFAFDGKTL